MRRSSRSSYFRNRLPAPSPQDKVHRVLNFILVGIALILFRLWHLTVIEHDEKVQEAQKPRERVLIEPAKRATIRDRFDIPLALNKIRYQAAIVYSQFRDIPSIAWIKDPVTGKKKKQYKRREHIKRLTQLLGEELDLEAERIEDLIYAKAAFFANIPYVIKDDLTEKEYYRLKMLEKDWPGICVRKMPKRYYPQHRVASDVVGYMGSISKREYDAIVHEIKTLEWCLESYYAGEDPIWPSGISTLEDAHTRLQGLEEKAYTIHDDVGKTGVEGYFEQKLRGFQGKKRYEADANGNFLRELPGSHAPQPGEQVTLTLSSELQEFAEQLLARNEKIRHHRHPNADSLWMLGGAIVAMDPETGEVLALASYPRFNPNDFISSSNAALQKEKRAHVHRWLENETYLGDIWDLKQPLQKEIFNPSKGHWEEEETFLTWDQYLDWILPAQHPVKKGFQKFSQLKSALEIQKDFDTLLAYSGQGEGRLLMNCLFKGEPHIPCRLACSNRERDVAHDQLQQHVSAWQPIKQKWDKLFAEMPANYDKLLFIDLCRLLVRADLFSPELAHQVGKHSLAHYHHASSAFVILQEIVKERAKEVYHDFHFKPWRKENEKGFLKKKRAEEKASHKYAKPYIDYLDQIENGMFKAFWEEHRWEMFITFLKGEVSSSADPALLPFLAYFKMWHEELKKGAHGALFWREKYVELQKNIEAIPPHLAVAYLRTFRSFHDLNRPLLGRYKGLRSVTTQPLEKHLASAFYPKYGYGYVKSYAYRQSTTQGSIFKIITAYEALIQRYHQLKKTGSSLSELNPLEITDQYARKEVISTVGKFSHGAPIPRLYKGGRVPKSLSADIGKIDLIRAIETSSNPYFALLAGDFLEHPQDLAESARQFSYGQKTGIELPGEIAGIIPSDLESNRTGLYSFSIGQHSFVATPLQTAVMLSAIANGGKILRPQLVLKAVSEPIIRREVYFPTAVRQLIYAGMKRSVEHLHETSLKGLEKLYSSDPHAIYSLLKHKEEMIGKSASAETVEHLHLDLETGTFKSTHVWFGGFSYTEPLPPGMKGALVKNGFGKPELVVVVYLRFGGYGKDAAPVAAQMIEKWRTIKQKHSVLK